jgi:nucleoside-diphosphate-sugar epimerase
VIQRYSLAGTYRRALVTGGAGFVGSHLVDSLLADGLEVVSLDDYSAGKAENLTQCHRFKGFQEVNYDITEAGGLNRFFEGVDVVFHQACSKNTVCLRDPARDLAVNALGTLNVLTAARAAGVKKFVHESTGSVYGEPAIFPSDEKHPLDPVSYYGVSKLAGDRYARLFHHLFKMDVAILRYYHVFGPRQDNSEVGGVVSIMARRVLENRPITIYGDGTQIRSFTYVGDVVDINKMAAQTPATAGNTYNCASGIKVTIQELAEAIRAYFKRPDLAIQYEDWKVGDIKRFEVDNAKLKKLGFTFATDFQTGLALTMESVRQYVTGKA